MNEQMSLFEEKTREYKEEYIQKELDRYYTEYNPCPKCGVLPIERKYSDTQGGWGTFMKCPICGYSCSAHHNKYEHWNDMQYYRVRDGKI